MSSIDAVAPDPKSWKAKHAKENLTSFVKVIEARLEKYFDNEIEHAFGVSGTEQKLSTQIWKHIKEHNLRPAKRLRGSFIYYGYKLLGGKNEEAILDAAMSIELVHTALLMHDDFMDQDDMRRGLPTTQEYFRRHHKREAWRGSSEHYGDSMALDIGDIALLAGYEILAKSNFGLGVKLEATGRLLRGVVNTGFGQAYDITLEAQGVATEKLIFDLHYAKTGIYTYENPLHVGAILAGGKTEDLSTLSKYAIPGGIAFQLQDDILGLFGEPAKTGKPAHSDLRQGKMTLLIIKAFKNGTTSQVKRLRQLWGKRDLSEAEADEARKIVIKTGSLDYSKQVSVRYAKQARWIARTIKKKGWNREAAEYLEGIAQYMVEREI